MKKFFVQNDFNYFQGVKLSFPPSQTIKRNDLSSIVGQSCHGLTASAQLFYFLKLVLIYLLDKQKQEFHAKPLNKKILEGTTGVPVKNPMPVIVPQSPAFALKERLKGKEN